MKSAAWIITLALLTFVAPQSLLAEKSLSNKINWSSYDEAQSQNKGDRKYFIYFYTDQCPACVMLKKDTFSNKSIIEYINSNYTPIKVDAGKDRKLASSFRIQGVPDLRFLSPKGENIGRWVGFIESKHLLSLLQYIETDSYEDISYKDFVERKNGQ